MTQLADEVVAAALLLGGNITQVGTRWACTGDFMKKGTLYYNKVDAAEGYLLRAGYQVNATGELQTIK